MTLTKLHWEIDIDAPPYKVWEAMLGDEGYREWTRTFAPDSHFDGNWSEGSRILFLGSDEHGRIGGMVARIREIRPTEFVSIEHIGMVSEGVEDTTSEQVQAWAGAREEYTLRERDGGGTTVLVELDTAEGERDSMQELWPKALDVLREVAERE
jgi:uncharacterized protein YndB with AHSA1/START domain